MEEPAPPSSGHRWFAGYLVAGSIVSAAQSFKKSSIDELIILVVAIAAGYSYHRLKRRIKIANEAGKIVSTYLILLVLSACCIGFGTGLADALTPLMDKDAIISGDIRDYFVTSIISGCSNIVTKSGQYSPDQVNKYCTCTANGTADVTTLGEAEGFKSGGHMSADLAAKATQQASKCKAIMLGQ